MKEIKRLEREIEEKNVQINALNQEIREKENLSETISAKKDNTKDDITNKETNLPRYTNTIGSARNKTKPINTVSREPKKAKSNKAKNVEMVNKNNKKRWKSKKGHKR